MPLGRRVTATMLALGAAAGALAAGPVTPASAAGASGAPYPHPAPVLRPLDVHRQVGVPTGSGLRRALEPLTTAGPLGGHIGLAVADPATGRLLLDRAAARPAVPASTAKLLTAAAVLLTRGPDARLTTRVVAGVGAHELILVGGGDPTVQVRRGPHADPAGYPRPATLHRLAAATTLRLRGSGVRSVRLRFDGSLFTGPAIDPAWRSSYVPKGAVAPVSALAVDEGRLAPGGLLRARDPARTAAQAFAGELEAGGIRVNGAPRRGRAAGSAELIAAIRSAPMSALVAGMLTRSDNDLAEALARQVALGTGTEPSFAGAPRAVRAVVARAGVDVTGVRLRDGSGLSRRDRIPPRTLAQLLVLAADGRRAVLRTLLTSLPVAGSTGTLAARYAEGASAGGRGHVRAKTGSLSGVRALAGTVLDRSGRLLVFTLAVDGLPGRDDARDSRLEALLDRIATRLAACGCR